MMLWFLGAKQVQGGDLKPKVTREGQKSHFIKEKPLYLLNTSTPPHELIIPNNLHSTLGIIARHDELDDMIGRISL